MCVCVCAKQETDQNLLLPVALQPQCRITVCNIAHESCCLDAGLNLRACMLNYSEVCILRAMHSSICRRCRASFSLKTEDIDLPVVPDINVPELPLRAKPLNA